MIFNWNIRRLETGVEILNENGLIKNMQFK
jgi:hypothetical protein